MINSHTIYFKVNLIHHSYYQCLKPLYVVAYLMQMVNIWNLIRLNSSVSEIHSAYITLSSSSPTYHIQASHIKRTSRDMHLPVKYTSHSTNSKNAILILIISLLTYMLKLIHIILDSLLLESLRQSTVAEDQPYFNIKENSID